MAITDSAFKGLSHSYQGYGKFSDGTEIMEGYKPDYVLKMTQKQIGSF